MSATRSRTIGWLAACVLLLLSACNTMPDKRVLQYLNTEGFGNRYFGNAEEENWLGIGDRLEITDPNNDELSIPSVEVEIDGTVILPELGAVLVAGLTRSEIQALLMEKYSPYFELLDIQVKIHTTGHKYFIFGEVNFQGEVEFKGDLTIFEAITKAQPRKDSANLGRVRLIRADPRDPFITTVDLGDIIQRGDSTFNLHVQERDIVYVPPTMLAQLGYFLDALLFPVKQVISGLSSAFYLNNQFHGGGFYYGGGYGNNGYNNGGIF
jgi:protein involved in polysaccharide export with SLBB domain